MANKEYLVSIELFEKRKDGFYRVDGKNMTQQEAIRRIARVYGCGHKAEAALKALLGVKK